MIEARAPPHTDTPAAFCVLFEIATYVCMYCMYVCRQALYVRKYVCMYVRILISIR